MHIPACQNFVDYNQETDRNSSYILSLKPNGFLLPIFISKKDKDECAALTIKVGKLVDRDFLKKFPK
jgi:hypothetical protein